MRTRPFTIILLALAVPWTALAKGGLDGGGGGAIHCEPEDSKPKVFVRKDGRLEARSALDTYVSPLTNSRDTQFMDLFEAAAGYGPFFERRQTIEYNDRHIDEQLSSAMTRLRAVNTEFAQKVGDALEHVRKRMFRPPPGAYVVVPPDTNIRYLPIGCKMVGLGMYSDSEDNLVVDWDVAKRIRITDRAAFLVHEAIYKVLRDTEDATNSYKTRRMVGLLFASGPITWQEMNEGWK